MSFRAFTFAFIVLHPTARTQAPTQLQLKPPEARLPEEFTNLTSLRELSDGHIARNRAYASAREWPVNVPPFDKSFPLLASPEGWLVIPRVPSADYPTSRYDFVDRTGALCGQLRLPGGARLLAFGEESAYVVVTDSDGIERLQRHPWP